MWSYSNDPSSSRKDQVRFLIGDTNEDQDEQLLSDEEINYALTLYPVAGDTKDADGMAVFDVTSQPLAAALVCAEAILARFRRQVDEDLPVVQLDRSKRAETYAGTVEDLRRKMNASGAVIPFVGGSSVLDVVSRRADDDRVRPDFYKGEHDNATTSLLGDD